MTPLLNLYHDRIPECNARQQVAHLQLRHLDHGVGVSHTGGPHDPQDMLPHQLQGLLAVDALCQSLQVCLVLNYAVHPAVSTYLVQHQIPPTCCQREQTK